ncbi:MAG: hypothetical protein ABSH36_14910, partial [Solirubrobacteraceae bacterium]
MDEVPVAVAGLACVSRKALVSETCPLVAAQRGLVERERYELQSVQVEVVEGERDEPVHQSPGDSPSAHLRGYGETTDLSELVLGQDRQLDVCDDELSVM